MKFLKTLIITLIAAIFLSICSLAADGVIYFTDPVCNVGDTVTVEMKIQSDNSYIGDATVLLKYPSDSIVFVEGTDTNGGAGTLRVHGVSNGKGTGLVTYYLKFRTPYAGNFNISLDTFEVYDTDGNSITIGHAGSSSVSVAANENASSDASLSNLEVSPGDLSPDFSPEITEYSVIVGLSVSRITINALPGNENSKITVSNNENLKDGDNDIIISVASQDGKKTVEYHINVVKKEGGAENITQAPEDATTELPSTSLTDGIQLTSKGKTITVTDPDSNVIIPEGFKESTISIDKQKVRGWIWGADETPKYCVVYGMNDQGELNFYRYDMTEKTIQRYFEDPLAADCIALTEYDSLKEENEKLNDELSQRFLIMSILAIVAFVFIVLSVYLLIKISIVKKKIRTEEQKIEKENINNEVAEAVSNEERINSRSERRHRYANTKSGETTVIIKKSSDEENKNEDDDDFLSSFEDLDI